MDEILKSSVTDPRGERMVADLMAQDLAALSVIDLTERIKNLKSEITRCEAALGKRKGATDAAEALFNS